MPSYADEEEFFKELDQARERFRKVRMSDFNSQYRTMEERENYVVSPTLTKTLETLDDIIYVQEKYLAVADSNTNRREWLQRRETEIKELQASLKGQDKTLLEKQRDERKAQLDAAPKKLDTLKKQIEFDQNQINVAKKLIAAEKEQLSNDPEGVHQKAREEEIQDYNRWMETRKQHEAQRKALEDSLPSLRTGLQKAESALVPFQKIEALEAKNAETKANIVPQNESLYNERQALLHRTLEDIYAQTLLPLQMALDAGLKDLGYPPMDVTGKNKNDVLVWDQKTKSLIPFADKALNSIDKAHADDCVRLGKDARPDSVFIGKSAKRWAKVMDNLHIYPNENSINPDIINFDMKRKNIFKVSTTPPEPPKEPTRGYQILDKIARFFGGRNATCKRYDAAYDRFVRRVDTWNGPEGYREYMDKRAEERAVKRPDEPVVKTVKSPEILKALAIARAKEVEAKQMLENMGKPQTAKVKSKSKAKSVWTPEK